MDLHLYRVDSLPSMIPLGKQTENGVHEIHIDCTAWLSRWPNLSVNVFATPPGGAAAYPANTHMQSNVLVWPISDADTAAAGDGYLEIVGSADGVKKLSATCHTCITATTTGATTEPPEPAQPWVDTVLDAARRAEEAAERAEGVTPGSGGQSYTLPTASADTKGGVMIGEGLQMDGEKLNAPGIAEINAKLAEWFSGPVKEGNLAAGLIWSAGSINLGVPNGTQPNAAKTDNFVEIEPSTTYAFEYSNGQRATYWHWYDADKTFLSYSEQYRNNGTVTSPVRAKFLKIAVYTTSYTEVTDLKPHNFVINKGTTITERYGLPSLNEKYYVRNEERLNQIEAALIELAAMMAGGVGNG